MAVFLGLFFSFFFCPHKVRPKKLFNDYLFFKEKTSQLFIFAIVYKKKKEMCKLQFYSAVEIVEKKTMDTTRRKNFV